MISASRGSRGPGFFEDFRGHGELAQVVEVSGQEDAGADVPGQAFQPGQGVGHGGHAARVGGGEAAAEVDDLGEGPGEDGDLAVLQGELQAVGGAARVAHGPVPELGVQVVPGDGVVQGAQGFGVEGAAPEHADAADGGAGLGVQVAVAAQGDVHAVGEVEEVAEEQGARVVEDVAEVVEAGVVPAHEPGRAFEPGQGAQQAPAGFGVVQVVGVEDQGVEPAFEGEGPHVVEQGGQAQVRDVGGREVEASAQGRGDGRHAAVVADHGGADEVERAGEGRDEVDERNAHG
jgi:hypothetical protein